MHKNDKDMGNTSLYLKQWKVGRAEVGKIFLARVLIFHRALLNTHCFPGPGPDVGNITSRMDKVLALVKLARPLEKQTEFLPLSNLHTQWRNKQTSRQLEDYCALRSDHFRERDRERQGLTFRSGAQRRPLRKWWGPAMNTHTWPKSLPGRRKGQCRGWGRSVTEQPGGQCIRSSVGNGEKGRKKSEKWLQARSVDSGWVFLNFPEHTTFTSALCTLQAKREGRQLDTQASIIKIQTTWIFSYVSHKFEENWYFSFLNIIPVELKMWNSYCLDMWCNSELKRKLMSPCSQEGIWYYKLWKAIP